MLLEDIISFQNVGLIGVSFYVLSYAGLQLGLLSGSGNSYTLMNLAAASLVLISLMETYNQSAALIQIIWIFMSEAETSENVATTEVNTTLVTPVTSSSRHCSS